MNKNDEITKILERIRIIDEASNIIMDIIDGNINERKVIRLRELAKEFVDAFNFSGPISSVIKLLPSKPIIPGAPGIRLALKVIDRYALKNALNYLNNISAITRAYLNKSVKDKFSDISGIDTRKILVEAYTNTPVVGGRIFEALSEIYLNKVHGWPELFPVDVTPWLVGINVKGKPDLISINLAGYTIYAAEISKSFKSIKDYKDSAKFLVNAIEKRWIPYPSDIKEIKFNYAIIAYEKLELNELEKIREAFNNKILMNIISKIRLHTEILDLDNIKQELEDKKMKNNPHAGHLFAILREMKIF